MLAGQNIVFDLMAKNLAKHVVEPDQN